MAQETKLDVGGPSKLLKSGSWNSSDTLSLQGGQNMLFKITNINVLGTAISIADTSTNETKQALILPQQTMPLEFDKFGSEPMGWSFQITSDSDAFIVTWQLYSTWVPRDPPNG